jgi:hypothetical protein
VACNKEGPSGAGSRPDKDGDVSMYEYHLRGLRETEISDSALVQTGLDEQSLLFLHAWKCVCGPKV